MSWKPQPLGSAISIVMGQAPPGKACNRSGEGVPFVKAGEFGARRPVIREWTTEPKKFAKKTDVLVCVVGATCGKINLGEDCAIGRSAAALRPDPEKLDQFFLHYFLHGTVEKLRSGSLGSAQTVISKTMLAELPIPLPPMEEQKRIVAVLDQAFAALDRARANAEANLADAEELLGLQREKLLDFRAADWTETTVGKICDGFEYGTSSKSHPVGRIPVLRMGNLQNGEIDWTDLKYTDDQEDIQKYLLRDGDVLFNRTNSIEHVGKSAIYRGQRPAIFAGYLIRVNYDPEIVDPDFLNIYLGGRRAKEYGHSVMGKSVNQANISASKLNTYPISLPKLSEQKEIAAKMKGLSEMVGTATAQLESKLANIEDLRQSIMQNAFAGELT